MAEKRGLPVLDLDGDSRRPSRGDLVLKTMKGKWLHPFETLDGRGKEYFLSAVQGCPFRCAYCFVQGYLDHSAVVIGANFDDGLREIEAFVHSADGPGSRIHAAHLGEWVPWEEWTGWTRDLVEVFRRCSSAALEIRTKTTGIESIPLADLPSNVVLSWTVTPEPMASRFEPGLPGPHARLLAARSAALKGASVGIRLDPVILLPGWADAYRELTDLMGRTLSDVRIEAVEMGTFRCGKRTADSIRAGPHRVLTAGDMQPGLDGKARYFWPLRARAYRVLASLLRNALGPRLPIRLCMEPPWLVRRVFGTGP